MLCMNTEDMYHPILRERVRYFKETEERKRIMCEIWDEVRNEGRIEQTNIIALNMLESGIEINTVIRCTGLTLEEVLKLKDNNVVLSSYLDLINEANYLCFYNSILYSELIFIFNYLFYIFQICYYHNRGDVKMKDVTLVVMAAGIGSRFGGGIKQLEPMGPNGEIIMDYSIHDAIETGFNKVVFVIRKDLEKDFDEIIGQRIKKKVHVEYAFQERDNIPEEYKERFKERTKPWGTGQAILACKDIINEPFLVINADDYYGKEGYKVAYEYLSSQHEGDVLPLCMVGFVLKNTLSDNGGVSRGVCKAENGKLTDIVETHNIEKVNGKAVTEGKEIDIDSVVSLSGDTGATIYYTTDGSNPKDPKNNKVQVGNSVVINGKSGDLVVIRTYSKKDGYSDSDEGSYSYSISSYEGGIYADRESGEIVKNGETITLHTDLSDAKIYYTTDGSTPSEDSHSGNIVTIYGEPGETITVMALAIADGSEKSNAVATFTYTIMNKLAAPTSSVPDGAIFVKESMVELKAESGKIARYYTS